MALLDNLQNNGTPLSVFNGVSPAIPNFAGSKLHDTYSINGNPALSPISPIGAPSSLDLDGNIPSNNYRDNAPEGRTF